jgi:hypothetical protein
MKANKDQKFELDEELVHKFELANKFLSTSNSGE